MLSNVCPVPVDILSAGTGAERVAHLKLFNGDLAIEQLAVVAALLCGLEPVCCPVGPRVKELVRVDAGLVEAGRALGKGRAPGQGGEGSAEKPPREHLGLVNVFVYTFAGWEKRGCVIREDFFQSKSGNQAHDEYPEIRPISRSLRKNRVHKSHFYTV